MDKCPLCNSDTEYFKQGLRCKNTRYITIFELYVRQKNGRIELQKLHMERLRQITSGLQKY